MKKKKKSKKITIQDYIKAVKRADRDIQIEHQAGWQRITSIHRNKKVYNRKVNNKNYSTDE